MRAMQGDLEDFQRCVRPAQGQPRRPNKPKPSFYEGPPQRSGTVQERFFKVGSKGRGANEVRMVGRFGRTARCDGDAGVVFSSSVALRVV